MAYLTRKRQREIDAIVQDVQLRTGMTYPASNLVEIAEAEDITVLFADLSNIGPNVSGVIRYEDDETKRDPRIYINTNIGRARQLFTLGHELGHHFLHKGRKLRLDTLDYSRNDKDTLEEIEANYFAAVLLVPEELLLLQVEKDRTVKEMASYFNVSSAVIENRIGWLSQN